MPESSRVTRPIRVLDVNLRARTAPLIGVICGEVAGWANAVVGECDVLIVPKSRVGMIASITSGGIVTSDVGFRHRGGIIRAGASRSSGEAHRHWPTASAARLGK